MWVWNQIIHNKEVNLYEYHKSNSKRKLELSSTFLEEIIKNDSLSSFIGPSGIKLLNAKFTQPLDLSSTVVDFPLWLDNCIFKQKVKFFQTEFKAYLSLEGSSFMCKTDMRYVQTKGLLNLNKVTGGLIDLQNARIGGNLELIDCQNGIDTLILRRASLAGAFMLRNSRIRQLYAKGIEIAKLCIISDTDSIGTIDFTSSILKQDLQILKLTNFSSINLHKSSLNNLSIQSSNGNEVQMSAANVKNNLLLLKDSLTSFYLDQAVVSGNFNVEKSYFSILLMFQFKVDNHTIIDSCIIHKMNGFLFATQSLLIGNCEFLDKAALTSIESRRISGFSRCTFRNGLDISGSTFNDNLLIRNDCKIFGKFKANNINVSGDLRLNGSMLQTATLNNSNVRGSLLLYDSENDSYLKWICSDTIMCFWDLSNLTVDRFVDNETIWVDTLLHKRTWPDSMDLRNFEYKTLEFIDRNVDWYLKWLNKSEYHKASYDKVADRLRSAGKRTEAKNIKIQSGLILWKRAPLLSQEKIFLSFMGLFTGFGQDKVRIFYIMICCVSLSMIVLKFSNEDKKHNLGYGLVYSLDKLLPIITLEKKHEELYLDSEWVRGYFYFQHLFGYLLITLLLASLAQDLLV